MSTKTEKSPEGTIELCCWCSIPLGSANTIKECVCIRCHTLLINAGLTEEEIFTAKKNR